MTVIGWVEALAFFVLVILCVKPLGAYMAHVFEGERTFLSPVFTPVEKLVYRICRIDPKQEMTWYTYLFAVLGFHVVGLTFLYLLLRTQAWLPLNPQSFGNLAPDLAWNTAVSFLTNTNWQFYSGESTMSYLSQMMGLAWHNWVSAALGICLAIALFRGIARTTVKTLGNFWVDMTRCMLFVFLPICIVGSLLLVWQGIPQNFHPYTNVVSIEGFKQTITQGPMASQEWIKNMGTNGGGFVNANSASPNENPTSLSNLLEMFSIMLIGASLTYTFGRMVKDTRQGWAVLVAMSVIFLAMFTVCYSSEAAGNPIVHSLGVAGGNMEGKEVRFGVAASALFATVTTVTSCGAVNSMHDSYTALGGLVPMVDIQLGEIIFGGVGSGMYGMLMMIVLTVFIAGLMVGRTPEYLGKKIERKEVQLAILFFLIPPLFVLVPAAIAAVTPIGQATLNNAGPHGFSEILYTFTSMVGNNGSAFAGIGPNVFYNLVGSVSMLFGRIGMFIPAIALAGALAGKKAVAAGPGTFETHSPVFIALLIGTIVIVGALTFFPADALGPVVEQLYMLQGKVF
jgi:K+-transporting ATPase ATPase A chain